MCNTILNNHVSELGKVDYIALLQNKACLETENPNLLPKQLFELIKYEFKKFARKIAMEKSKNDKKNEAELNRKIKAFEENPNLEEQINYNNAKMQLQFLSECRIKGQILRSKTNYYEYGEKSTKFFLNLEKKRAESSALSCLLDENGILQTDYKIF